MNQVTLSDDQLIIHDGLASTSARSRERGAR